jgi:hypothetical protein
MLCDIVVSLGKRPVLWADIALRYPEYIRLLPKETIFVDWNYGWDLDRFGAHEQLVKSGYEIWGAPAIRSSPDNYYVTEWQHHFNNISNFIPVCRKLGYKGVVMTSWSTSGEYAPSYESEDDLVDLAALRHVYPITGFDILISAYFDALKTDQPLAINKFITHYCRTRFGFDENKANLFQNALFIAPYTISKGKVQSPMPMTIKTLLDSARIASKTFHNLEPLSNKALFEPFRLMADIRVHYLSYMEIETAVNSENFNSKDVPGYLTRLKNLMAAEPALNKRFAALNHEVLYPAAINEENMLRNQKVQILYDRLARIK